jgi:hypothetical protein
MRQAVILVGCAWILWGMTQAIETSGITEKWSMVEAYQDQATCERVGRESTAYSKQQFHDTSTNPFTVLKLGNVNALMYYKCIPDTIDPRAPRR